MSNKTNQLSTKLAFVKMLCGDLCEDCEKHITNLKKTEKEGKYYWGANYRDKNTGKTALKRKIVFLRQELLNLEAAINEE